MSCISQHFARLPVPAESPAFVRQTTDGRVVPITHSYFVKQLRHLLDRIGENPQTYSGHSLRRGCATLMFQCGIPLENIKRRGDWMSLAVLAYLYQPFDHRLATEHQFAKHIY